MSLPLILCDAASPAPPSAGGSYTARLVVKSGDRAGSVNLRAQSGFVVDALNDQGQITLIADNAAGGDALLQSTNGTFTPIVAVGQDGPGFKWPPGAIGTPTSTNEAGNVAFSDAVLSPQSHAYDFFGTFMWDPQARKVTALALMGMPAINGLTFTEGGDNSPAINNRNEVVFPASVSGPAGPTGRALFFRGQDGKLQPVLLPGQALPDGVHAQTDLGGLQPSLNDAGVVAFLVRREGDKALSAYTWERGKIAPVATVGMDAPGGRKITSVSRVLVNNQNHNVLVAAGVGSTSNQGLYLFQGGTLTRVAAPGQDMPGSGKLLRLQETITTSTGEVEVTLGVSRPDALGQHAFLALLEGGSTGAYRMDTDGTLSLILQSGTTTSVGTIANVGVDTSPTTYGVGIGLNSLGQVALPVQTLKDGPTSVSVILLTPATP